MPSSTADMAVSRPAPAAAWLGIAGPTACGKTAAALALARERLVEIVSVDSALVYRGMDIGTAKPSAAELTAVPHHLIDIRDPSESYNAAAFVADATRLVAEIRARGRMPLLVGGTMLYFKALIDGIDAMPAAEPAVRARLDAEGAALGWPAMHAKLAEIDPIAAARLSPNDSQRIQRALEVWHASGQPLSSFHAARHAGRADTAGSPAGILFSLEPTDRAWLHERIARRFDAMLDDGFLDEVRALRARGDLRPDMPSMRCVGYRQAWEFLDECPCDRSTCGDRAGPSIAAFRERGIAATRQLAKRQITWLRSMPARRIIPAEAPDAMAQLVHAAMEIP